MSFYTECENGTQTQSQRRTRHSHWIAKFGLNDVIYINSEHERGQIAVSAEHRGDSLQSEFLGEKNRANYFP
jgi:hypothetical protein